MFFNDFLLGKLEDNIILLRLNFFIENGYVKNNFFAYPNNINLFLSNINEYLFYFPFSYLSSVLNSILVYNLFVFLNIFLSIFISYKFFAHFFNNRYLSSCLSIILTFSPYFYYQSKSHLNLSMFWMVLLILYLLLKEKGPFLIGILTSIVFLISSYLGFFGILMVSIYQLIKTVTERKGIKRNLTYLLIVNATFFLILIPTQYPFIAANFLESKELSNNLKSSSTIEDFITFSSRPWYFFLPPVENPIFGNFTYSLIKLLESRDIKSIFHNYFPSEHSSSYLGILNIFLALIGYYLVYLKKFKKDEDWKKHSSLKMIGLLNFIVIILSINPILSLNNFSIYLPSYLLYEVFPMFRVLSRLGIYTLSFTLIFSGITLIYIITKINHANLKRGTMYSSLILIIFTFTMLVDLYIPLDITYIKDFPKVYGYIKDETNGDDVIAVYPHSQTDEALFWIHEYNRRLMNPRGISNKNGFDTKEFTLGIQKCEGILRAINEGLDYLVVFPEEKDFLSDQSFEFFSDNYLLSKIKDFEEQKYTNQLSNRFVNLRGANNTNRAIVYKVRTNEKGRFCRK